MRIGFSIMSFNLQLSAARSMPSPSSLSLLSAAVWPTSDIAVLLPSCFPALAEAHTKQGPSLVLAYTVILDCDWLSLLPPLLSPAGGRDIAFNSLFTPHIALARCFQGPSSRRLSNTVKALDCVVERRWEVE